ncbi:MAG: EF-hand domain-containing protein [Verrucomicrobiales bacterium]|nr:EF-hand domain-containing protein [Verrucomicrobiales bacterium]
MKKILLYSVTILAGLSLGLVQADDEKGGKGKGGKGKGGDPAKRAEMMIKKLDKDGNGTVSKEEFAAGPMAERFKDKEGALDKVFAARDTNSDGELDATELAAPPKGGKGGKGKPEGKGKGKKGEGKDKKAE